MSRGQDIVKAWREVRGVGQGRDRSNAAGRVGMMAVPHKENDDG